MKRKETESEREIAEKWKDVAEVKEAYNDSLLPDPESPPGERSPERNTDCDTNGRRKDA